MTDHMKRSRSIDQVREVNWAISANDLGASLSSTDSSFRISMALFLLVLLLHEVSVSKGIFVILFIALTNLLWFWRVSTIEKGRDTLRSSSFDASLKQVSEEEIAEDRDKESDEEKQVATVKGSIKISLHSSKICEHLTYIVFSAVFVFL